MDGGVSRNDFICQLLADMSQLEVERSSTHEMSVLGAGFFAGLSAGIWKTKEDIARLRKVDRVFHPTKDAALREAQNNELAQWLNVVERFKNWYS